ncbi:MAG: hypothetical protein JXX28_03480 [Deltaproteobacteria bacterium]|nr:hypothetical protein [Deltaproteobacteria bacterium]
MTHFSLNLPDVLHAALARKAAEEGVPIDWLAVQILAKAVAIEQLAPAHPCIERRLTPCPDGVAEAALARLISVLSS